MTQFTKTMASPVGALTLIANEAGLSAVLWQNDDPKRVRAGISRGALSEDCRVSPRSLYRCDDYFWPLSCDLRRRLR